VKNTRQQDDDPSKDTDDEQRGDLEEKNARSKKGGFVPFNKIPGQKKQGRKG